MGRYYKTAEKRLEQDEKNPLHERSFELLLLANVVTEFDAEHGTIKDVLGEEQNMEVGRVALRIQIIRDPTRPLSVGDQVLQFFAENPDYDKLFTGAHSGVIFETDGSKEIPLFFLTRGEVLELAHGAGFSVPIRHAMTV